ncbi:MAG: Uma2 family endonuclease [Leptolyngbyaceae cyanobacterium SL_7_1]|nr:Uma2 family endonuclease [Leptolyngbyaceae cyanobacterium SL_7_1]
MFALISPERIQLPPGTVVRMPATWAEYQALSQQRGDGSIPRMKYRNGEVLLMAPMPKHGRDAHILGQIVSVLLDHLGQEYDAFTPVTMELPEESGIEPDYCFYIDHWQAVSGKARIDWRVDPPPDLVIEIDVTTYTAADDYLPYRVPEIWLLKRDRLTIHQLQGDRYELATQSRYFPEIPIEEIVVQTLQRAYDRNTSSAIRALRQQLHG